MRTATIAVALTLAAILPLTAEAGTRSREKVKIVGHTAVATWDYTQGDIVTFVNVVVTNNNIKDEDGRSQDAFVSLAISQANVVTGDVLIAGVAYSEDFDFHIDRGLDLATLHVNDAIFQDDSTFTFFNVDIDLAWSQVGDETTQHSHDSFQSPGFTMKSQFKGRFRDAVASGSIFGKNQQFTPMPSTTGQLQFNKFGSVTVITTCP